MKVFLVYDEQGTIVSGGIVVPEFSDQLELVPGDGQGVLETTLDNLGIKGDMEWDEKQQPVSKGLLDSIVEAVPHFRFDQEKQKLMRREDS